MLAFVYTVYRLLWRITRPITLGVRLMMVKEGKILLVKHSYQPHWYMPGGAVKQGELAQDAAAREAREEVGAELHAPPVLFGA